MYRPENISCLASIVLVKFTDEDIGWVYDKYLCTGLSFEEDEKLFYMDTL